MKKWNLIVLFVCSYYLNGYGQWTQMGASIDALGEYEYGAESVSLDSIGNTLVIGSPRNYFYRGYAKVVDWNGTSWVQRGNIITGDTIYGLFGRSTSISADGNIIAIGAPFWNEDDRGQISVYKWNGTAWNIVGDKINGGSPCDLFGNSVSLNASGTTIVCGAKNHYTTDTGLEEDVGLVQIFDWNGTSWIQRGNDIEGVSEYGVFGSSVSMSRDGNTVVIGAEGEFIDEIYGYGKTMVFDWSGTAWVQRGSDIWGEVPDGNSGHSVDIDDDGNSVVVGSFGYYSKVFDWNGTTWVQRGLGIDENDPEEGGGGIAVAMSADGNSVIIGSPFDDNASGQEAGKISVFDWNGTAWVKRGLDILGEYPENRMGNAVSISADGKIVACAYWNVIDIDHAESVIASVYTTYGYSVSLSEISFPKFSAFPNPTKGNLTIELGQHYEYINLGVNNMIGQTVFTGNYKDIDHIELDLDLEDGMYTIEIVDSNNSKSHFNIIKGN